MRKRLACWACPPNERDQSVSPTTSVSIASDSPIVRPMPDQFGGVVALEESTRPIEGAAGRIGLAQGQLGPAGAQALRVDCAPARAKIEREAGGGVHRLDLFLEGLFIDQPEQFHVTPG